MNIMGQKQRTGELFGTEFMVACLFVCIGSVALWIVKENSAFCVAFLIFTI